MRRRIFYILFGVSLLTAGMLTGCAGNAASDDVSLEGTSIELSMPIEQESPEYDFPEFYEDERDNILFETKIIIQNRENMGAFVSTTAELQAVDEGKLLEVFFSDVLSYDIYENESKNERGEKVTSVTYVGPDEIVLSVGPYSSTFSYSRPGLSAYVNRAFRLDEKYSDYNAEKYSLETGFSFKTRREAFTDIKERLQEVGLQIGDSYKAYALDHVILEQEEYCEGLDGLEDRSSYKPAWTEGDDCYYFIIGQEFQGLPVYHVFVEIFKEAADVNAPVQVKYSSEGIESIHVEKVFKFAQTGQEVLLADFEDIAETVISKYGMILGNSTYKVTEAELYYMVDVMSGKGVYDVFPAWILSIEENTPDEGKVGTLQMVVNAVTAEEIP